MSSHKPANVLRNRAVTRENFTLFSVLYCTEMCTRFHSNCSDSSPRCRRTDHSIVFATWLQRVPWAHANLPQTSPLVHPFCQAHWCARQRDRPRSRHDVCSSSPHFMLCMRYAAIITLTIQGGGANAVFDALRHIIPTHRHIYHQFTITERPTYGNPLG